MATLSGPPRQPGPEEPGSRLEPGSRPDGEPTAPGTSRLESAAAARRRRHLAAAALIAGAFVADVVLGAMSPIFPLLAKRLGATTADLAALVAAVGFGSLLLVVPVGRAADRLGKRWVFTGGMACYGVAALLFATARSVVALALPQLLDGAALVATFTVGLACLSDTVTGPARPRAVGLYTAAMGSGYGVGPLLSGWAVGAVGYRATFLSCAVAGLAGAVAILAVLVRTGAGAAHPLPAPPRQARAPERRPGTKAPALERLSAWWRAEAVVVLASFTNLPTSLVINVGLLTFFPVYAAGLGWSTTVIGVLLFGRASASAVSRLGVRLLSSLGVETLSWIRVALVVEVAVLVGVSFSHRLALTAALLVLEGINYGFTMSLAQLSIVTRSAPRRSASSLGLWNAGAGVAQLAGGALVAVLVGRHSARSAMLIVVAICVLLLGAYVVLDLVRRRQAGAPEASQDTAASPARAG